MKSRTRINLGKILFVFAITTFWIPFVPTITLSIISVAMILGKDSNSQELNPRTMPKPN